MEVAVWLLLRALCLLRSRWAVDLLLTVGVVVVVAAVYLLPRVSCSLGQASLVVVAVVVGAAGVLLLRGSRRRPRWPPSEVRAAGLLVAVRPEVVRIVCM